MESATIRRAPPLPDLVRLGLIGALIFLAVVAWTVTDERMGGMDAGPGTDPGTFGFFITAWVVMMAAMMFPSIAPMVMMYVRINAGRRERGQAAPVGATSLFVSGYLVSWAAAGGLGYAIYEGIRSISIDALSWDRGGPYIAGGIIVAAAAYQLTPLKDVCLRHCRSPLMFLMTRWEPGRTGALRMGVEHGAYCVGCCWMLMAALFALGVMSIGWMAFIAALIATEKLLPWRALANRGVAVLLLVLGLGVAFAPERIPGLILPGSPEAAQAMQRMMSDDESMKGMSGGESSKGMSEDESMKGDEGAQQGGVPMGQQEQSGAMPHEMGAER